MMGRHSEITRRHGHRKREIEVFLKHLSGSQFDSILEIGAGDGYQSRLLSRYGANVHATDLNASRLPTANVDNITYSVCDAEHVDECFPRQSFDFVFSSNVFEHLPDVNGALGALSRVTKPSALVILIMPNRLWKVLHIALWYLHVVRVVIWTAIRLTQRSSPAETPDYTNYENNLKSQRKDRGRVFGLLVPKPHGAYPNHWQEFLAFGRRQWTKRFENNRYRLVRVLRGPFSSGYAFSRGGIALVAEKLGFSTEYAYVIEATDWFGHE